jgi:DNA-binding response OmpR family regulator
MRVLVIEDDHKIANALKKALEQEKYAVDVSYDGDDGYAMATTEPYDVAIVDRMIPGEYNGLQIVEAMRKAKIHTPVLLLTALSSIRDRTKGLDSGADDYLVKPFALEELLARVRALIRRPAEQQASVLQYKDLSMDTNNFVVKRADKTINLTSREFSLLEYLMRNPERTVTKDVIISHVWNYDADILPNTVEVYIKYLRGKIDAPFKTNLIHTIRGFGYRLGES